MKNIIIIVILIIILGVAFYFTRQYVAQNPEGFFGRSESISIGGENINVLLADTDEERIRGLSGRVSLNQNQGMLFTFDKPDFYGFWMKDMKFPIDIIFLNDGKVVTIFSNVQPAKEGETLFIYKPEAVSNQVLELNANKATSLGIKVGDTIDLP